MNVTGTRWPPPTLPPLGARDDHGPFAWAPRAEHFCPISRCGKSSIPELQRADRSINSADNTPRKVDTRDEDNAGRAIEATIHGVTGKWWRSTLLGGSTSLIPHLFRRYIRSG
ncbi:MAG: hypothetical protein VKP70_08335 [Cyanobacteriota bacterium]|nr:hypothetical protein [Cyanobacteriota bacterium]